MKPTGGYAVLWGNLAPEGAVIKVANQAANRHRGPARVFDSEQEAFQAVSDGRIVAGDVVVVRYQGPKGGPGMPEMTHLTSAIVGAGLVEQTALLTDGRFGGGTQGISVGHISPEAAADGPLAILRDGDVVEIDAEANRLDVDSARRRDRGTARRGRASAAALSHRRPREVRPPRWLGCDRRAGGGLSQQSYGPRKAAARNVRLKLGLTGFASLLQGARGKPCPALTSLSDQEILTVDARSQRHQKRGPAPSEQRFSRGHATRKVRVKQCHFGDTHSL